MPPLTSNRAASRHYTDTGGAAELRAQDETLPDKLLAHIAPLGWEHISFKWRLRLAVRTAPTEGSALRNPRSGGSGPVNDNAL
jgi:hypothetical protein